MFLYLPAVAKVSTKGHSLLESAGADRVQLRMSSTWQRCLVLLYLPPSRRSSRRLKPYLIEGPSRLTHWMKQLERRDATTSFSRLPAMNLTWKRVRLWSTRELYDYHLKQCPRGSLCFAAAEWSEPK